MVYLPGNRGQRAERSTASTESITHHDGATPPRALRSAVTSPEVVPLRWLTAELHAGWMETRSVKTLLFALPGWEGHEAGQHVDVKLTAENGYTAQRSYSVASASRPGWLELTVQTVTGGEVSPYLVEDMRPGDRLEVRGPIGGWFQWTEQCHQPVLLVAGGSGIVPLMAMIRHRIMSSATAPFHLIYLARTPDHVIYTNELHTIAENHREITVDRLYSRGGLPDDHRTPGRLTPEDLPTSSGLVVHDRAALSAATRVYVCGPTGFVEHATRLLQLRGHHPDSIRTERFGP